MAAAVVPSADEPRHPRACGGRRAAIVMSQRQVLQGRTPGGRPDGGRREPGTKGRPAPPGLSPQCSSSTRKPGPSSCRWWQSWQPDPKTSRLCRMRVSPAPPALCHQGPWPPPAPGAPGRPGSSALPHPSPGSPAPRLPVSPVLSQPRVPDPPPQPSPYVPCHLLPHLHPLPPGLAPLWAELLGRRRMGTGGRRS